MTVIWNNRSADTNGNICSTTARPASRLDPPRFSLRALEPDSTKRSGVHWVEENLEVEEVMETPEVGPGDMLLMRDNAIHATQSKDGDFIDPAAARAEKLNSSVGQERSMPTPAATQATEDRRVAVRYAPAIRRRGAGRSKRVFHPIR